MLISLLRFGFITLCLFLSFYQSNFGQINELNGIHLTQKASDVPYNLPFSESYSDGSYGFVHSGHTDVDYSNCSVSNDRLYSFNPSTQKWQLITNLPGPVNYEVGFTINNFHYMLVGTSLWRYDPPLNLWTQRAQFPSNGLLKASCFVINNRAFITCGYDGSSNPNNVLFQYDAAQDTWSTKANFPGLERETGFAWSINGFGYIGSGFSSDNGYQNDVWKYDPATDTWTQCSNFPVTNSYHNNCFAIGTTGYVRTKYDFWSYNTLTDTWTPKNNFPDTVYYMIAFSAGNKGYLFKLNKFFEYDPVSDSWIDLYANNYGLNNYSGYSKGVSFADKAFVNNSIYDPFNDSWSPDLTGATKWLFSCYGNGYAEKNNLFQKWDPVSSQWTVMSSPPAALEFPRDIFTVNDIPYVIEYTEDTNGTCIMWSYGALNDTWTRLDTIQFLHHFKPYYYDPEFASFPIGSKGYIAFSRSLGQSALDDLHEYDPSTNQWTQKANFPAGERVYAFSAGSTNYGYVGLGKEESGPFNPVDSTIYRYDPATDTWSPHAYIYARSPGIYFTINNVPFVGGGERRINQNCDEVEYNDFYSIDSMLVNEVSSISNSEKSITLFPNPASTILHANIPFDGEYYYSVNDILGNTVIHNTRSEKRILQVSTELLKPGIYFLTIRTNKECIVLKFLVNHIN